MTDINDNIISSKRGALTPQEELNTVKIKDLKSKLLHRRIVFYWIIIVLTFQNGSVYYLFFKAMNEATRWKYAAFSILISGTLLATYGALKIIVSWLYKDSSYKFDC